MTWKPSPKEDDAAASRRARSTTHDRRARRLETRLRPSNPSWQPDTGLPGLLFAAFLPLVLVLSGMGAVSAHQDSTPQGLELQELEIEARITDGIAVTEVGAVYENPQTEDSGETRIAFPFPETGVLTEFSMTTPDETFIGIVDERAQAQQTYDEAVEREEHAVLLESAGKGRLALRVNVPAGETLTLNMTYAEVLPLVSNEQEYSYPLDQIAAGATLDRLEYTMQLHSTHGWSSVSLAGLHFTQTPGETNTQWHHESTETTPEGPVSLKFKPTTDGYSSSAAFSAEEGEAAGVFQILPDSTAGALPMDIVFLVDVSGSMGTGKMNQAKDALDVILDQSREQDRFGLAKFSTGVSWHEDSLQSFTPRNVEDAHDWVGSLQSGGGTNIAGGLEQSFGLLEDGGHGTGMESERLPVVVLITDGQPTSGMTNPREIVHAVAGWNHFDARVHTVGIGFDQDNSFLGELADANRGIYRAMDRGEDASEALVDFYDEIATPVLRDVMVEFPTLDAKEVHPDPLRDVYGGSHLVVAAHVDISEPGEDIPVVIRGQTSDNAEFEATVTIDKDQIQVVPEAANLWARQKAITLERQLEFGPTEDRDDTRKALVDHGIQYNVATSVTSWVIVKESELDEKQTALEEKAEPEAPNEQAAPVGGSGGGDGGPGPGPAGMDDDATYADADQSTGTADDDADPIPSDTLAQEDDDEEATPALPLLVFLLVVGSIMGLARRRKAM